MKPAWERHKPYYFPTGAAGNGKRNMYETGTSDKDYYTNEEFCFLKAIDRFKQDTGRAFPTYHEILKVLKSLGYKKDTAPERSQAWDKSPPTDSSSQNIPIVVCALAPANPTTWHESLSLTCSPTPKA